MGVIDNIVFVSIQLILLTVGSNKVASLLLKDFQPPSPFDIRHSAYIPHLLFSLTLSCSCTLFLLVFSEIIHLFSNTARSQYWKWNLDLLLLLVIIVIPWFQLYSFLHITKKWRSRLAIYASTILWAIYLYLFSQINQYTDIVDTSWIEIGIFRISIVGITIISILSGFGVVNAPFNTWSASKTFVSEHEYQVAEQAYHQTEKTLSEKRKLLDRMRNDSDKAKPIAAASSSSFFGRMISSIRNPEDKEIRLLQDEVDQLEGLCSNMRSDLNELERGRDKSKFSQTWKGKLWGIIDKIFAVYCVYKLIVTTINVIFRRSGSTDPITRVLSIMMSHLDKNNINYKIDPVFWSQQLSFWFAGIIVFGSVRGFLKILTRVLSTFALKVTFSTSNILLFVAHMMGMYFLSSVLMMQMSLPSEYRYLISSSLSVVEFDYFRHWSDIIFVCSSIISSFIIYVIYITHDAKSMATDFADIQLLSLERND